MKARFNLLRAIRLRLYRVPLIFAFFVSAYVIGRGMPEHVFLILTGGAVFTLAFAPLPGDVDDEPTN